ncbi:MAG: hypothetical protein AB7P03_03425 [Kofleriaceae bacterium]
MRDLLRLRALPVHPLGVSSDAAWADGRWCSPAEFFFHDVDHARFKVREDLVASGHTVADAYRDGETLDPSSGLHRTIVPEARPLVGSWMWEQGEERLKLIDAMVLAIDKLADRPLATMASLLLFEIVHEKSFPIDRAVLARELGGDVHCDKIRRKHATGFFAADLPDSAMLERMDAARRWLLEML